MKKGPRPAPTAFHLPPYPEVLRALSIFLEAFKEAAENNLPPWEYAVELPCFMNAGVPPFHLRWLMDKEIIEHGYEQVRRLSARRHFRLMNSHVFQESSCFVLKGEAVGIVRDALLEASIRSTGNNAPTSPREHHFQFEVPVWNKATGQLWYENDLVKEISGTALNQRKVLDVCQDSHWQQPIPNPFRGTDNRCLSEPLHNTLERLNRNQINRRLYFFRDGTGKNFRWKPVNPGESGPHPGRIRTVSAPQLERKRPSRP